jgi:small-conductance mechanosensitive channel
LFFVIIPSIFPGISETLEKYYVYLSVGITLLLGYMIVSSLSDFAYRSTRLKYEEGTAGAVRSVIKIIGVGSLLSGIAGAIAGGAAGVALGGFIGIVIGQASQQIIGQGVAGLIVLVTRPISIGDRITVSNETGVVRDISTMSTIIERDDKSVVMIPNSMLMGSKIYKFQSS